MVLIRIALVMSDIERLFMSVGLLYVLFGSVYSGPFPFLNWIVFWCLSPLYMLELNPSSPVPLADTFYHTVGPLLIC